jgi:hypothetical protein
VRADGELALLGELDAEAVTQTPQGHAVVGAFLELDDVLVELVVGGEGPRSGRCLRLGGRLHAKRCHDECGSTRDQRHEVATFHLGTSYGFAVNTASDPEAIQSEIQKSMTDNCL